MIVLSTPADAISPLARPASLCVWVCVK
jgi:hypothetical protein